MPDCPENPIANDAAVLAAQLSQLNAENALFRLAIEQLPLGLSMFDANDILILTNARYGEVWELPDGILRPGKTSFAEIMRNTQGEEVAESKAQAPPAPNTQGIRQREWALYNGKIIEVTVARMKDGSCVALHKDVTQKKQAEEKIAYLARTDQTTQLLNRHGLDEALSPLLASVSRSRQLVLFYLDLDRFKMVNDTYGHAVGDALLREVGARIKACTRQSDLVVRLGGDEFIVVQQDLQQPEVSRALAARLIESISQPYRIGGHVIHIGVSIGTATAPRDGSTMDALVNYADLALYRAKESGRGICRDFAPDMDQAAQRRRQLEFDLSKALTANELQLVYQPIISLGSGQVTAVEALLRWQHATLGAISPAEFIPIAEDTGLVLDIGRWVLHQACADAKRWPEHIDIAVNVSPIQLLHGDLQEDIQDALQKWQLPANRLEIELTESVMMKNPALAQSQLKALKELGVKLAMDDFGTGYSSLSYLHHYPFDRIKIDRSFMAQVHSKREVQSIVKAIIALSTELGLHITVEGIETAPQFDFALAAGAHDAQGYLFAKPMPQSEITALILSA